MDEFPMRRAMAALLAVVLLALVVQLLMPSPSDASCPDSRASAAILGFPDRC